MVFDGGKGKIKGKAGCCVAVRFPFLLKNTLKKAGVHTMRTPAFSERKLPFFIKSGDPRHRGKKQF